MPDIVAKGRKPEVIACAYCHTPTGQGRPENSAAGRPARGLYKGAAARLPQRQAPGHRARRPTSRAAACTRWRRADRRGNRRQREILLAAEAAAARCGWSRASTSRAPMRPTGCTRKSAAARIWRPPARGDRATSTATSAATTACSTRPTCRRALVRGKRLATSGDKGKTGGLRNLPRPT